MIVIHHNPACGTSRNVLKLIEATGDAYQIIPYLDTGWTRAQLAGLFAAGNLTPKEALRTSKSPAQELDLLADDIDDETILEAMIEHPILVNRPIVCSPKGVALCRPSERVLDLLPSLPSTDVFKEDGDILYTAEPKA